MKNGINPITVILAGIILFVFWMVLLCGNPVFGQVIGVYGLKATEQPDNVIYVGEGLRYSSIASAVASCPEDGIIVLHPGTYTDTDVTISKRIKIIGTTRGDFVKWTADSMLFTLAIDSVEFENIYFQATADGRLADVGTYDWLARDCTFDFYQFDPAPTNTNFAEWEDISVLSRKSAGFSIGEGDVYTWGDFHVGLPLGYDGVFYGVLVNAGGLLHCEDKANIYAEDSVYAAIQLEGSGQVALQEGGLIANKMSDNEKGVCIRALGSSDFMCNSGDLQATSDDSAVVVVRETASVSIYGGTRIHQKGSGVAYLSTSSAISYLTDFQYNQEIYPASDDIIIPATPAMVGQAEFALVDPQNVADSTRVWSSRTDYSIRITRLYAVCDADDFSFILGTVSTTGGTVTVIDTLTLSDDGVNCYYQNIASGFDSDVIPAGYKVWFKPLGAVEPGWLSAIIGYVFNDN